MKKFLCVLLASTLSANVLAHEQIVSVEKIKLTNVELHLPTTLINGEACRSYIAQSVSNNVTIQKICDVPNKDNSPKGLVSIVFSKETGTHQFELTSGRVE